MLAVMRQLQARTPRPWQTAGGLAAAAARHEPLPALRRPISHSGGETRPAHPGNIRAGKPRSRTMKPTLKPLCAAIIWMLLRC